jgi:hypothetical protein
MNSTRSRIPLAILLIFILTTLACAVPQTLSSAPATPAPATTPLTTETIESSLPPSPAASTEAFTQTTARPTSPPAVADHRIAIHRIYGIAEFYDTITLRKFIPRGVNYFILVPIQDHYENRLFASGVYDHARTRADFSALSAAGYNTVRIILDGCTSGDSCIGVQDSQGLNPAYLDNIVDLMHLAKDANLFLLFSSQELPELGGYAALADQEASATFASGRNAEFLTAAGIHAAQQYWSDLLGGLVSRHAPFDVILGWELIHEQYYLSDQPPFTLQTEKITPANKKTYYMFVPAQVQDLAVDGMRYYIDQLRQTILTYDPTALITMGFFAPISPNPWRDGDNRYVETTGLLTNSNLDFFDLHTDPAGELTLPQLAQNFGMNGHVTKPVLMGAVGASTWAYPQVSDGAIAIQDWIAASCSQGFNGWAYTGYYPSPAGLANATWGFVDSQNYLMIALSPKTQPDACTTNALPGRNLALNKPVEVTEALSDQIGQMAVDGDPNTQWSAGAFPTQWIQIDLGAQYNIGEIRLTVGQWPAGQTVHQVWVGASRDSLKQVYEFSGREFDYDVLEYIPTITLQNIRFVRIVTTESPSWVSWREIEVLAPFPATPKPTLEPSLTPTP